MDDDEKQLGEYLEEERAIHPNKKAICILANTNNDRLKFGSHLLTSLRSLRQ